MRIYKTKQMVEVEIRMGVELGELILSRARKGTLDQEIAREIGINPSTMSHWIKKLGIWEEVERLRLERRIAELGSTQSRVDEKDPGVEGPAAD